MSRDLNSRVGAEMPRHGSSLSPTAIGWLMGELGVYADEHLAVTIYDKAARDARAAW